MRVVVIAVKDNRAAVAGKGGALKYIENMNYEVGQILDVPMEDGISDHMDVFRGKSPSKRKTPSMHRFGSSFAAAAAVLIFTGAISAYAMPLSFVTIDVNPSLSLGVNAFNRVITAEGTNDDGSELMDTLSGELMGKELQEAVDLIFSGLRDNEYIAGMDTPAEGTVRGLFSDRRNERMINELNSSAERWNKKQKDCSISFETVSVTKELRIEAERQGMTPGRMMLERRQEELIEGKPAPEADPDNDLSDNTPVRDAIDNGPVQDPSDNVPVPSGEKDIEDPAPGSEGGTDTDPISSGGGGEDQMKEAAPDPSAGTIAPHNDSNSGIPADPVPGSGADPGTYDNGGNGGTPPSGADPGAFENGVNGGTPPSGADPGAFDNTENGGNPPSGDDRSGGEGGPGNPRGGAEGHSKPHGEGGDHGRP